MSSLGRHTAALRPPGHSRPRLALDSEKPGRGMDRALVSVQDGGRDLGSSAASGAHLGSCALPEFILFLIKNI